MKATTKRDELRESLKELLSTEEFDKYIERNTAFLLKFRGEVEELKRRKWHRDINDYMTDRVYNWTSTFTAGPYRGNKPTEDLLDSESFLGVGSPLGTPRNALGEAGRDAPGPQRTRYQRNAQIQ